MSYEKYFTNTNLKTNRQMLYSFLGGRLLNFVESTCAYARWARMHCFPSVCYFTKNHQTKIHISGSVTSRVMKSTSKVMQFRVKALKGQIRIPEKGRWAHNNVKLLHLLFLPSPHPLMINGSFLTSRTTSMFKKHCLKHLLALVFQF